MADVIYVGYFVFINRQEEGAYDDLVEWFRSTIFINRVVLDFDVKWAITL